jgi:hypothetical protein
LAKKTEEAEETALATVKADVRSLFDPGTLAAIQQEYGVTPADVTVPIPATPTKLNLDQLCSEKTQVFDQDGNLYDNLNGHSGPLMYLEKTGEYDGEKFSGYDGFYVYAIVSPEVESRDIRGKVVITIGRPIGEKKPGIVAYLDGLSKGQLFQVASFKTSHGFRVFNPIPVQQNGKLLS